MLKQRYEVLIIVSNGYPSAKGRLPTRYSPVRRFPLIHFDESPFIRFSLDLHVLGTPPAFILSQDQTLNKMFITHIFRCLYSVTRMTHYASLLCFEFSRTNKFCLFVFSFKVFHFQDFRPVNSRPVLHYEVFKVPLCFSATACLVYTTQSFLSRTFSEFFKFFFVLLLSCCSVSAAHWLKKSGLLFALFSSTRIYYSF